MSECADNDLLDQRIIDLIFDMRALNALDRAGIKRVRELISLTPLEVLSLPNIGSKSLAVIREGLAELGLSLKEDSFSCPQSRVALPQMLANVLKLRSQGLNQNAIARRLQVSPQRVSEILHSAAAAQRLHLQEVQLCREWIRRERRSRNLSQYNLATIIDVKPDQIRLWENGGRQPSAVYLLRLMLLFGLRPVDVMADHKTRSSDPTEEETHNCDDH